MSEESSNFQKQINRREMLKKGALATGAAVTAAAFLDGKWLKSVVKTGILPVHAQASMCVEYTFVPLFVYNDDEAFELRVNVLPASPTPPDGPIQYDIINQTNITLTGALVDPKLGYLSGGTATFPGSYTFSNYIKH